MPSSTDSTPAGSTEDLGETEVTETTTGSTTEWLSSSTTETTEEPSTSTLPAFNATTDELRELLLREQATNAALQKHLDNERRLRREAEDIIDERQDEVYERDAELRRLREEAKTERQALEAERERLKERLADKGQSPIRRKPTPSKEDGSDSGDTEKPEKPARPVKVRDTATTSTSSSSRTSTPTPSTASPSLSVTSVSSTPFLGPTKYQAGTAYAALIASVKAFVETQLAPVFALRARDIESSFGGSVMVVPVMSRTRSLLKLMNPRARMFLRLKGADSVHFNAILIEFLRRHIFTQPYGGIFKVATGPVPSSPAVHSASPATILSPTPRVMSKMEARLAEVDDLAERMEELLSDLDAPPSRGVVSPATSPSVRLPYPKTTRGDPADSSPSSRPSASRDQPRLPRHSHSMSDSSVHLRGSSSSSSPSSLHREPRLLRAQLIDRVLSVNSSSSWSKPRSSPSSESPLPSIPPPTESAARLSALYRHIDARVYELSAELAPMLLPLRLALAVVEQRAAISSSPDKSSPIATLDRAKVYADLERAISSDLIRPAVQLVVHMQLGLHSFAVRWVEHDKDSPSLSVCEALGLDYKRIPFGGDRAGEEAQYSFVFDVSPALFMTEVPQDGAPTKPPSIIYAQGVLLQKGEVLTDQTFVHWLHETGSRSKSTRALRDAGTGTGTAAGTSSGPFSSTSSNTFANTMPFNSWRSRMNAEAGRYYGQSK
ncbi:hypothetical protein SEUCBS140593_005539 [Sporothrix eucalyptigena]|uniref:Uncharacterized protein n=1 Tax=Sporothrix eucalyptigena TaxID=1812306 RepID=A0ABP0BX90_9PEZI